MPAPVLSAGAEGGRRPGRGRRLLRIAQDCGRAARRYGRSYPLVAARVLRLYLRDGFQPRESLRDGLADPRIPAERLRSCISKRRLDKLQSRLNPERLACLTEDKDVFYLYCQSLGIPTPALLGVFDPVAGWSAGGAPLAGATDWERFFTDVAGREFVVKPVNGVYGQGFNAFRRAGGVFQDAWGAFHTPHSLYASLRSHRRFRRWVIQERLRNHPDLARLSGTEFLQTVRIITFVAKDGQSRAYFPVLKVIGGDHPVDNIDSGRTGNLVGSIRPQDGVLEEVLGFSPDGLGTISVPTHPRTGVLLPGFALPFWKETLALVERIAPLFLPIRTIGWDVAITGEGPVIVEGNMWWDPPNAFALAADGGPNGMRALIAALEERPGDRTWP